MKKIFKCTYVNFTFILFVTKKVCKVRLYLKLQLTKNEIRTHRAYTKIVKNLIWTKRIIRVYAINYNWHLGHCKPNILNHFVDPLLEAIAML